MGDEAASCAAQGCQTLCPAGTGAHLRDPRVRRLALAQLDLERDLQAKAGRTHDFAEGIAAFLEKRKPEFRGA